jgi:hypothetical protein
MAEILSMKASEHDKVQELLPWYVTDTLSADEHALVDAHLERCAECRQALVFERQLADGVATLPLNVEDGWNAMSRRMEQGERSKPGSGNVHFLKRRVPVAWTALSALAAAATVAFAFVGLPSTQPGQTYHTLSAPGKPTDGQLVVLFKPDTTEQQLRVILAAQGARLVDGPTTAGAYVLRVDNQQPSQALAALRQSGQVVLAEPIEGSSRQ